MNQIRNFCIIAHIDHGKSTLADRIIQLCDGLTPREMKNQVLDSMEIEKERGITIKAQTASLIYKSQDNQYYNLNLIDTPGHVDFSYEVSRSLSACEGALLVIDVTQGIEAQTVANFHMAVEMGVKIIPIFNKIDLLHANIDSIKEDIENVLEMSISSGISCSAKTGFGVKTILEELIKRIPPPCGSVNDPLQALIIDSWFDNYVGVVILVKIVNGLLKQKDQIYLISTNSTYSVEHIGMFTPKPSPCMELISGEVGFVIANIKNLKNAKVGDTIIHSHIHSKQRNFKQIASSLTLPGFKEIYPQVFSGLYPVQTDCYEALRNALEKLKLNDYSLIYEPEVSQALGFGFRCGFLGLLHMEIIQERLEREFNMNLIITAPTVMYEVLLKNGKTIKVDNPSSIPDQNYIHVIKEPIGIVDIFTPKEYVGSIIELCHDRRGTQKNIQYIGKQVQLIYDMPMSEIVHDFSDHLKSISNGYASISFKFKKYEAANVVKIDILVNNSKIDALSSIVHNKNSRIYGRFVAKKLSEIIPRQMFEVTVQAAIHNKIIARENIKSLRKNVLAKCYGGDITRKKKLLEKQKEGKRRMKQIGNIEIPKEAFFTILQKK